jgi:hypothetical protein
MTLDEIGLKAGTDKASSGHNYLHFYEKHLSHLRHDPVILVEAGIGGYEFPDRGGESLKMWRKYFTHDHASIVGFDVYEKNINIPGTRIHQISQDDETKLNFILGAYGGIDIFIDDASHINPLSIRTFEIMFPLVKPGGVYIWEDIHTSFWVKEYKGVMSRRSEPLPALITDLLPAYERPGITAINFLHDLQTGMQVDTLEPHLRGPWDGHIQEMHFMRNTCVIIKRK